MTEQEFMDLEEGDTVIYNFTPCTVLAINTYQAVIDYGYGGRVQVDYRNLHLA